MVEEGLFLPCWRRNSQQLHYVLSTVNRETHVTWALPYRAGQGADQSKWRSLIIFTRATAWSSPPTTTATRSPHKRHFSAQYMRSSTGRQIQRCCAICSNKKGRGRKTTTFFCVICPCVEYPVLSYTTLRWTQRDACNSIQGTMSIHVHRHITLGYHHMADIVAVICVPLSSCLL